MLGSTRFRILLLGALATGLVACASPHPRHGYYGPGPKAQVGAFTGAAAGGLIGSAASGGEPEAIIAGVLLGGLAGGAIGDSLDRRDRIYAARSFQRSLEYEPTGYRTRWHNPDSGHSGSFTPTRTFETASGYCREYSQTVTIGGRTRRAYGEACRQPDGTWHIQ